MNMSIMYNIAFQILAKTRKVLWKTQTPDGVPEHTMLIGADVFHNTRNNKNSVVGFCASMDSDFTKFHSQSHVQPNEGEELIKVMGELVGNALDAYKDQNGRFPEMIVFYRDGVGESQTNFITDTEIPAINETFTDRYGAGNEPKFTEILVNKRIDDRFFLN
jgi:aubergine-like protein